VKEQLSITHVLATASLHDGGGIFTLAFSLIVIPVSLGHHLQLPGNGRVT
jgi:hypothetical protein